MGSYRTHVLVCGGAGCASSGCKDVEQALTDEITKQGLADEIRVIVTGENANRHHTMHACINLHTSLASLRQWTGLPRGLQLFRRWFHALLAHA
jgi:hypothetical protein